MPGFEAGQKGEYEMNKTIWALAFVVLCSGTAFAMGNASATPIEQSGWVNTEGAGDLYIEGGNVSETDLDTNASTEKWAGAYGNITGNLVLAEDLGTANFMYFWTYNPTSGGEVCVTQNPAPVWVAWTAMTRAAVDNIFAFAAGDADSAANTYTDADVNLAIAGTQLDTTGKASLGATVWETGAINVTGAGENQFAFCVNISNDGTNYWGGTSDYQVMMPTTESTGSGPVEHYYFYMELI